MQQINQIIIEGIVYDIYDKAADFTIIHNVANSNRSFEIRVMFDNTKIQYIASKGDKVRIVGKLMFIYCNNSYSYIQAEHIEVQQKSKGDDEQEH